MGADMSKGPEKSAFSCLEAWMVVDRRMEKAEKYHYEQALLDI
jgi:hypothetical protein